MRMSGSSTWWPSPRVDKLILIEVAAGDAQGLVKKLALATCAAEQRRRKGGRTPGPGCSIGGRAGLSGAS